MSPVGTKRTCRRGRRTSVIRVPAQTRPEVRVWPTCMVRPCVTRGFRRAGVSGLASMYPVSDWSSLCSGQYGYQRACDLINGQASTGRVGHQC